jgi:hypothetical protein
MRPLLRRRASASQAEPIGHAERVGTDDPVVVSGHEVGAGGYASITLDYPVFPQARWGHGRPSHPLLQARFERERERYRAVLEHILTLKNDLVRIPVEAPEDVTQPCWNNGWLPGQDSAALYSFLVETNPALYLEVGSGNSTKFARRAIADHGLRTRLVSIDPSPRAEIDGICDEVVRAPAESVGLDVYQRLQPGDVLFIDNSHRCLQNSDATALFLDVFPQLAPDVLIEIHDIMLPDDYPPEWFDRFYTEQYLLAVLLLAPGSAVDTVLPGWFTSHDPELMHVLDDLWDDPRMAGVERHGGSFWLKMSSSDPEPAIGWRGWRARTTGSRKSSQPS